MSENKDANDLAKLLDETLGDFEKRKVTDDELDEIMNEHDRTAIQKSAQEFDVMLSKLSEQLQPGNGDSDLLPEVDDPAMMDLFSTMKDAFFAQDMSPMIRATAEKYDGYLAEKGPELSAEQREAYEKQRDQLKVIAEEYAKPEPDPAEMDNRLKEIKKHWEKLQEYGDPPSDLFPVDSMNADCNII